MDTKILLPGMLDRGHGTIVNITSSAATMSPSAAAGKGGWAHAYAVGKASGHWLVPTLHVEFADCGTRAFNVEPGFVATERNMVISEDMGHDISRRRHRTSSQRPWLGSSCHRVLIPIRVLLWKRNDWLQ